MSDLPVNVAKDLARRGLDEGYLIRAALAPFLQADGKRCVLRDYMDAATLPPADDNARRLYLIDIATKASTWRDADVAAAGKQLLARLTKHARVQHVVQATNDDLTLCGLRTAEHPHGFWYREGNARPVRSWLTPCKRCHAQGGA